MGKLIGYTEMKNKKGKVLYCTREVAWGVGEIPYEKPIFLFGDESDAITPASIGKEVNVNRGITLK